MTTIDVSAILAEARASTPHGLCPYCSKLGPVEARDPEPPHYAPHAECEEAEGRVSAPAYLWHEGGWGFGSWGPGALLSYAAVAFEALQGVVVLGAQPSYLEPEWW